MHRGWILAVLMLLAGGTAFAMPPGLPPYDFFAGEYAVVGRLPDGGAPYAGKATISAAPDGLLLTRRVGDRETTFRGRFEKAAAGDTEILLFQGATREAVILSCLFVSDPDNYPRLSCLWGPKENRSGTPGLEAYFPVDQGSITKTR
jgi:hypothetical protein